MLNEIYVTQQVEGQPSFHHIWIELWEGSDGRYSREYLGQGQGRTPEEAIADYIRLETAHLEDMAARLKAGTLDIEVEDTVTAKVRDAADRIDKAQDDIERIGQGVERSGDWEHIPGNFAEVVGYIAEANEKAYDLVRELGQLEDID